MDNADRKRLAGYLHMANDYIDQSAFTGQRKSRQAELRKNASSLVKRVISELMDDDDRTRDAYDLALNNILNPRKSPDGR